jgi:hypothetical protein
MKNRSPTPFGSRPGSSYWHRNNLQQGGGLPRKHSFLPACLASSALLRKRRTSNQSDCQASLTDVFLTLGGDIHGACPFENILCLVSPVGICGMNRQQDASLFH